MRWASFGSRSEFLANSTPLGRTTTTVSHMGLGSRGHGRLIVGIGPQVPARSPGEVLFRLVEDALHRRVLVGLVDLLAVPTAQRESGHSVERPCRPGEVRPP